MSVAMVPNWARIRGTIQAVAAAPGYEEFSSVQVRVEQVNPVAGFANLLEDARGKEVTVLVPKALIQELGVVPGQQITARVRRAGLNRVFAHPQDVAVGDPPR